MPRRGARPAEFRLRRICRRSNLSRITLPFSEIRRVFLAENIRFVANRKTFQLVGVTSRNVVRHLRRSSKAALIEPQCVYHLYLRRFGKSEKTVLIDHARGGKRWAVSRIAANTKTSNTQCLE